MRNVSSNDAETILRLSGDHAQESTPPECSARTRRHSPLWASQMRNVPSVDVETIFWLSGDHAQEATEPECSERRATTAFDFFSIGCDSIRSSLRQRTQVYPLHFAANRDPLRS